MIKVDIPEEFLTLCEIMVSAFQVPMDEKMIGAYWLGLKDLAFEVVTEGVYASLKTHEFKSIPSIALIRRLGVGRTSGSEWGVALGRVMQSKKLLLSPAIGDVNRAKEFVGKKGCMTLEAIGGSKRLRDMPSGEYSGFVAQFRDVYQSISSEMAGGQPLFGPQKLRPIENQSTEKKRIG